MRFRPARDNRGQNVEIQMLAEEVRRRAASTDLTSLQSQITANATADANAAKQANRMARFLAQ